MGVFRKYIEQQAVQPQAAVQPNQQAAVQPNQQQNIAAKMSKTTADMLQRQLSTVKDPQVQSAVTQSLIAMLQKQQKTQAAALAQQQQQQAQQAKQVQQQQQQAQQQQQQVQPGVPKEAYQAFSESFNATSLLNRITFQAVERVITGIKARTIDDVIAKLSKDPTVKKILTDLKKESDDVQTEAVSDIGKWVVEKALSIISGAFTHLLLPLGMGGLNRVRYAALLIFIALTAPVWGTISILGGHSLIAGIAREVIGDW